MNRLSHYELLNELGTGGMGTVYRARDLNTNGLVAVKVLHAHLAKDPDYVTRLRREARIAEQLDHPNIVRVHEQDFDKGSYFLAMELVEGENLSGRLRREGRLSEIEALGIALGVTRGLQAAYQEGVIHRDVKAGNILLGTDGSVKVADFGVARDFNTTGLTHTGLFIGTVAYAAPEVAEGRGDVRSDLYSLGVVLYQMLSGRMPFEADTPLAILHRHRTMAPDLGALNASRETKKIVSRLLAKDPAKRYQEPFQAAAFLEKQETAVGRAGGPWPTRSPAATVAASEVDTMAVGANGEVPPRGKIRQPDDDDRARFAYIAVAVVALIAAIVVGASFLILHGRHGHKTDNVLAGAARTIPGLPTLPSRSPFPNASGALISTVTRIPPTAPAADLAPIITQLPPTPPPGAPPPAVLPPSAPSSLTATPLDTYSIRYDWTDSSNNEDGFRLSNNADPPVTTTVGPDITSYVWGGFLPGTYTCLHIQAFSQYGDSAWTEWACATTQATTPYSVSLSASATSVSVGTNVTLTANSNVDVGPTPYYIAILEDGTVVLYCGSGTSCTYTANSSTAATRSYVARISSPGGTSSRAQSSTINVSWNTTSGGPPSPPPSSVVVQVVVLGVSPPGLGAWTLDIVYDAGMASAIDCTPLPQGDGACNPTLSSNRVRVTGAHGYAPSLLGDVVVADVRFRCERTGVSYPSVIVQVLADDTPGNPQPMSNQVAVGRIDCPA